MNKLLVSTLLASILSVAPAIAQTRSERSPAPTAKNATPPVRYQASTRFDFGDEEVEGGRANPLGEMVSTTRPLRKSSLVQPRDNFQAELVKSVDGI